MNKGLPFIETFFYTLMACTTVYAYSDGRTEDAILYAIVALWFKPAGETK